MKRKPREMVEITYRYKGETYVRADDKAEAIDRIESLTRSGAVIIKVEQFKA